MKVSIDTNAYTRLGFKHEPILNVVNEAREVYVSSVVLGELYAGFRIGSHTRRNFDELEKFLELPNIEIVEVDKDVADRYGILVKTLRQQGTPIPTNDIWIAATALESGSRLITYDNHFNVIPGLVILSP